jgi:dTDP-4-amino-4,6-dideoxygalactose transaminase
MDVARRFPLRYRARSASDLAAIETALAGNSLSGESELIARYEHALAAYFGCAQAVAVSSGTAAIHLSLLALGATAGTEVLVPAIAPLPSLLPVLAAGATPVVVDVCPDHLGFDAEDLARKITPRTRAALAVLLWGYPQDLGPSIDLLDRHGIALVEDACQAHGTTIAGRLAGRVGRIGCFSTHDFKLISTGEGGFVLTDDRALADFVRRYGRLGGLDGHHAGVNYKLSALGAALGLQRLAQLPQRLESQRGAARALRAALRSKRVDELPAAKLGEPNYYAFVLLARLRAEAMDKAVAALARHGLDTDKRQFGYDLVYRRPMFAELATPCPNAERLIDRALQLPCHPGLSPDDIGDIAEIVSAAVEQAGRQ